MRKPASPHFKLFPDFYFRNLLLVFGLLLSLPSLAQESRIVFESKDFVVTSEWVTYTYKDESKKWLQSIKVDHFKLTQKGNAAGKQADIQFEDVYRFGTFKQLYIVKQKGLSGVLDLSKGQVIIPCAYRSLSAFSNSMIAARDKKETIFDLQGKKLINATFTDAAYYESGGLIYDKAAKDLVFYNLKGELIRAFPKTKLRQLNKKEMVLEQNGQFGIFDIEGKEVIPFKYADAFFCEQTLVLAKKSPDGIKYGMFTASDLQTEIFPFQSDYLCEISITNVYTTTQGFAVYNAGKNELQLLDEQKLPVAVFNHFASKKDGFAAAKNFASLDILDDYYIVSTLDETYRVYLKDGQSVSSSGFSFYSMFENGFEEYIFFVADGKETLALPYKYKSAKSYHFPFSIYGMTKLSDQAYLLDTDNGQNVFRPYKEKYILDNTHTECETDYRLLEDYKTVLLSTYGGKKVGYDIVNDSLFLYHSKMQKNTFDILFNYLSARLTPIIRDNPLKSDSTVTEIFSEESEESPGLFRYTDEYGNQIFPESPYRFNFTKFQGYYGAGDFFLTMFEREEDTYYSLSTILDSKLRILKPYSLGSVIGIYPFPNDTIIVSEFYGNQDSMQVYSTHWKKTVYYSRFEKLVGEKFLHPIITRHGIMSDGIKIGLISFKGELLIPFEYELYTEDPEENENSVLDLMDKDGIHTYYFTKPRVFRKGSVYDREFIFLGSDAYVFPETIGSYRIYDKNTGKPLLEQALSGVTYLSGNRYAIVEVAGSFGIFDLKMLRLAEEIRHGQEQIQGLFDERYSMEQMENEY